MSHLHFHSIPPASVPIPRFHLTKQTPGPPPGGRRRTPRYGKGAAPMCAARASVVLCFGDPIQNGRLSDHFDRRSTTPSFSKKFKISSKSSQNPGQKQKINKKEPGETNFLGLFCESLFRDNVLVCGGTSTRYLRRFVSAKTIIAGPVLLCKL